MQIIFICDANYNNNNNYYDDDDDVHVNYLPSTWAYYTEVINFASNCQMINQTWNIADCHLVQQPKIKNKLKITKINKQNKKRSLFVRSFFLSFLDAEF